jgi:hypothetical protein
MKTRCAKSDHIHGRLRGNSRQPGYKAAEEASITNDGSNAKSSYRLGRALCALGWSSGRNNFLNVTSSVFNDNKRIRVLTDSALNG